MKKKRRSAGRKKRIRLKLALAVVILAVVLALLGYLTVLIFQAKQFVVKGNQYSTEQEIIDWISKDKYSGNSLYVLWKYNRKGTELLPLLEDIKVKLLSPRKVQIQVSEKTPSGRIDFEGGFLYFDKSGIAVLKSADVIEGVPHIAGMEIDSKKVELGKTIPVKDEKVFEKINELSLLLEKHGLVPDKISCDGTDLTLYFGVVCVQLGNREFEVRVAQIPPILAKLSEQYPGQSGVLHLENYEANDSSIRFVPGAIEEQPAEAEGASEEPAAEEPAAEESAGTEYYDYDDSQDTWSDGSSDMWYDEYSGLWYDSAGNAWYDQYGWTPYEGNDYGNDDYGNDIYGDGYYDESYYQDDGYYDDSGDYQW